MVSRAVCLLAALVAGSAADPSLRGSKERHARSRTPVIIDTDMDTDDQMALVFLLSEPSIEVKAITVLADGWSYQWSGVQNAMRLTQLLGQPDIPVAYSPRYNGDTELNLKEPSGLPNPELLPGIGAFLSEYVPLPFNERPPSWMYASKLIRETLRQTEGQVDIIELGPLTTLAHVLQEEPELFREKVRRLYMSGGQIVARDSLPTDKVWPYSSGTGPSATSFTGSPPHTEWNIFADPIAAHSVFSFGVPIVIGSTSFQHDLNFSTNDTSFIPATCPEGISPLLHQLVEMLPTANNESESELKYWDESLAVLAVQMIQNKDHQDVAVCNEWERKRFAVMLEGGMNANVSGGRYARLLENRYGQMGLQCVKSNSTEFKTAFYSGICGNFHGQ